MSEGLVDGQSQECCKLRDWCFACSTYSKKERERGRIKVCKCHMKALKIARGDNAWKEALKWLTRCRFITNLCLHIVQICRFHTLKGSVLCSINRYWVGIAVIFLLPAASPVTSFFVQSEWSHLVCLISCKDFFLATVTDKILIPG